MNDAQECELSLIGACVTDPDEAVDTAANLAAEDFIDSTARALFMAILATMDAGQLPDLTNVARHLNGSVTLSDLLATTRLCPSSALASSYRERVRNAADRRRLAVLGATITASAADPSCDPATIRDDAMRDLGTAAVAETAAVHVRDVVPEAMRHLADLRNGDPTADGLTWGIAKLDAVCRLRPGELVLLAARPGVGKSALALCVALHQAQKGNSLLYVTAEMSACDLTKRAVAVMSGVGTKDLADGAVSAVVWQRVEDAALAVGALPLRILDLGQPTVRRIRREALLMQRREGLGLVIVDYIGLLRAEYTPRDATRERQIAELSGGLKATAKDLGIPVLALVQLNRAASDTAGPKLHHLRDSGSQEADADTVALLDRDIEKAPELAALCLAKQRNGPAGQLVALAFDPATTRYHDVGEQDECCCRGQRHKGDDYARLRSIDRG